MKQSAEEILDSLARYLRRVAGQDTRDKLMNESQMQGARPKRKSSS